MSLVKIEDFKGTIVSNMVIDILYNMGVLTALNQNQYIVDVVGEHGPTPMGLVDDEPKEHKISFVKNAYVGRGSEIGFVKKNKIDKFCTEYSDSIEVAIKSDMLFGRTDKENVRTEEKREFTIDKVKNCWYTHTYTMYIEQNEMSTADYALDIVKTIADVAIKV